jgi:hypothetical protein
LIFKSDTVIRTIKVTVTSFCVGKLSGEIKQSTKVSSSRSKPDVADDDISATTNETNDNNESAFSTSLIRADVNNTDFHMSEAPNNEDSCLSSQASIAFNHRRAIRTYDWRTKPSSSSKQNAFTERTSVAASDVNEMMSSNSEEETTTNKTSNKTKPAGGSGKDEMSAETKKSSRRNKSLDKNDESTGECDLSVIPEEPRTNSGKKRANESKERKETKQATKEVDSAAVSPGIHDAVAKSVSKDRHEMEEAVSAAGDLGIKTKKCGSKGRKSDERELMEDEVLLLEELQKKPKRQSVKRQSLETIVNDVNVANRSEKENQSIQADCLIINDNLKTAAAFNEKELAAEFDSVIDKELSKKTVPKRRKRLQVENDDFVDACLAETVDIKKKGGDAGKVANNVDSPIAISNYSLTEEPAVIGRKKETNRDQDGTQIISNVPSVNNTEAVKFTDEVLTQAGSGSKSPRNDGCAVSVAEKLTTNKRGDDSKVDDLLNNGDNQLPSEETPNTAFSTPLLRKRSKLGSGRRSTGGDVASSPLSVSSSPVTTPKAAGGVSDENSAADVVGKSTTALGCDTEMVSVSEDESDQVKDTTSTIPDSAEVRHDVDIGDTVSIELDLPDDKHKEGSFTDKNQGESVEKDAAVDGKISDDMDRNLSKVDVASGGVAESTLLQSATLDTAVNGASQWESDDDLFSSNRTRPDEDVVISPSLDLPDLDPTVATDWSSTKALHTPTEEKDATKNSSAGSKSPNNSTTTRHSSDSIDSNLLRQLASSDDFSNNGKQDEETETLQDDRSISESCYTKREETENKQQRQDNTETAASTSVNTASLRCDMSPSMLQEWNGETTVRENPTNEGVSSKSMLSRIADNEEKRLEDKCVGDHGGSVPSRGGCNVSYLSTQQHTNTATASTLNGKPTQQVDLPSAVDDTLLLESARSSSPVIGSLSESESLVVKVEEKFPKRPNWVFTTSGMNAAFQVHRLALDLLITVVPWAHYSGTLGTLQWYLGE